MREVGTLAGWVLGYVVASQIGVTVIQRVGNANGGLHRLHQRRPAVPDALRHPRRLAADRAHAADVAGRGPRRQRAPSSPTSALGARLSAWPAADHRRADRARARRSAWCCSPTAAPASPRRRLIGIALACSAFGLFSVRAGDAAAAGVLRDARRPHADLDQRLHGRHQGRAGAADHALFHYPRATKTDPLPSVHAVEWLSIATSASYVVGAVVGHVVLTRRLGHLGFRAVVATVLRVAVASASGRWPPTRSCSGCQAAFGTGHGGAAGRPAARWRRRAGRAGRWSPGGCGSPRSATSPPWSARRARRRGIRAPT